MSFFQNLMGIIGVEFQFNKGDNVNPSPNLANKWVAAVGAIEARSASNDLIVGRGLDPVDPNDWVTLQYAESNFSNLASVKEIRVPLPSGNAAAGTYPYASTTPIAPGAVVIDAEVDVTTAYTLSSSPTVGLAVDPTGTPQVLQSLGDNYLPIAGLYSVHMDKVVNGPGGPFSVGGTLTLAGAGTAGAGFAVVRYVDEPLP